MTGRARVDHLVQLGRHAEALHQLEALLAAEPRDRDLLALRVRCLLGLPDHERALAAARDLLLVEPGVDRAHRLHALALEGVGRYEEGLAATAEAVRLDPLEAWNHVLHAQLALHVRGRGLEAQAAATRAVELDPALPDAHVLLGVAAERRQDVDLAREAYRRALALDPDHVGALNNLTVLDHRWSLPSFGQGLAASLRVDPSDPTLLANVDWLATRLVRRVLTVAVAGYLLGLLATGAGRSDPGGTVTPVSVAVLVGVLVASVGWSVAATRRLPAGVRLHLRSRLRRSPVLLLLAALAGAVLVLTAAVCVVPGGAAVGFAALRPVGIAVVVAVVGSIVASMSARG